MAYWHMQLHPDWDEWGREKELLKKFSLIGLGYLSKNNSQINKFKNEIKIDDIILIKRGQTPIALVKVIGELKDVNKNNNDKLDWFRYRREVKVLAYAENMPSFPQPRGTLQKAINKYTRTYQYIDNWYKKYLNPKQNDLGLKIRKVFISNYKMFNNFNINFLDINNKPLPIVVIAGKNGTGKTTLLECIKNRDHCLIEFQIDENIIEHGSNSYDMTFLDDIIYLDALIQNDKKLEELILDYINYFIYEKNENAVIGVENLQADMDDIFDGFDLSFYFKKIDYKTKKPIFGNEDAVRDDIGFTLKDLSTGERTLLSKVLYLHLKEPKNKVLLIDEPETSLHPSWQNRILKFYENFAKINNNQIIIATHSPHIIGSAKNEWIRILTEDGVLDNFSKSYGLEFSQVLTDIMGVNNLRTPDVEKDFSFIKKEIYSNNYRDNPKFEKVWKHLEENLENNDIDLDSLRHDFELMKKIIFSYENVDKEKFQEAWNRLERSLGKSDLDLKLLRLEMKFRDK